MIKQTIAGLTFFDENPKLRVLTVEVVDDNAGSEKTGRTELTRNEVNELQGALNDWLSANWEVDDLEDKKS